MAQLTFQDVFGRNPFEFGTQLTTGDILLSLVITFILALFIYFIYKKTYSGVLYSKNFNVTLIVISLVVAVVMMGISWNIALSLGMVGALSIVRFRTAVKDPKDVTFLFWAITVGIVNGVQFYKLSIISSIFIGIVLLILNKRIIISHPYLLIIKYTKMDRVILERILKRYCQRFKIRNVTFTESIHDITIEVKISDKRQDAFMKEIKQLKGVTKVMMFAHTGELTE